MTLTSLTLQIRKHEYSEDLKIVIFVGIFENDFVFVEENDI